MITRFQRHIAGDLPQPFIRGERTQFISGIFAIHLHRKTTRIMGTQPVAGTRPNTVSIFFGDLHLHGGILHRHTGQICGNQIAAAHKMDILGVLFPTALAVCIYGIQPDINIVLIHSCFLSVIDKVKILPLYQ